jgi:hypothetical protein
MCVIMMYDVFFFTLKKIFRPIKIIFHYQLNMHAKNLVDVVKLEQCTVLWSMNKLSSVGMQLPEIIYGEFRRF